MKEHAALRLVMGHFVRVLVRHRTNVQRASRASLHSPNVFLLTFSVWRANKPHVKQVSSVTSPPANVDLLKGSAEVVTKMQGAQRAECVALSVMTLHVYNLVKEDVRI